MAKKTDLNKEAISPDLVAYSRVGDTFHYRWAARRCLHLLDFNSDLEYITIEGSKEPRLAGEYVIDTAEYRTSSNNKKSVEYFQLKHSTTQCDKDFTLSDLKKTIEGFANRFRDIQKKKTDFVSIKFTIITNRPIGQNFKNSIINISKGKSGGKVFDKTIKTYTRLSEKQLKIFCKYLKLSDGEGDYDAQKYQLHKELSQLTAETNDVRHLLNLVELIRSRIEPKTVRKDIKREDVLEQLGFTSIRDLFPAPPEFECLAKVIHREQHNQVYQSIINSQSPFTIVTAVAGTGKSITCTELVNFFSDGSLVIAYDCFGNGGYRRLSSHRHRICDAYVQIINELSLKGLCNPILPVDRNQDDRLTQIFLTRLSETIENLRKINKEALLVILFDAVDNAEMAAKEFGDKCFARYLLKETIPEGCKIVYFSRPERIDLFEPPATIPQISIKPFSDEETFQHLQSNYPNARIEDAIEFNRLTSSNPRVQANAIALGKPSIDELLIYLSKGNRTVDDLIETQLKQAINSIKDRYPSQFKQYVEDICTGLASLPPFIPIEVLAAVSNVDMATIHSFIVDLGRPLWLTDDYVQFRDEPTETWFMHTYAANQEQIKLYISRLEPLAEKFSYVAEALPSLLLKSGQYDKLITLALSEDNLPSNSPVEARSVQIYRLQFAFKAALKNKLYADACKLALRAGEEVAGNKRQLNIFLENIDLIIKFLPTQRVMELAHQRILRSEWKGSENIYAASLLSSITLYSGEARNYLRTSWHWLRRYFEEDDKKDSYGQEKLTDNDVLAMFYCYYHLEGEKNAIDFIRRWRPDELIYRIIRIFVSRLIDESQFEVLERIALYGKDSPAIVIAITHELMKVGKVLDARCLAYVLNKIVGTGKWLDKPNDNYGSKSIKSNAYLSFFEACIISKVSLTKVKRALNYYIDEPTIYDINNNFPYGTINNFFRLVALQACINNNYNLSVERLISKLQQKNNRAYEGNDLSKARSIIDKLLPHCFIRANFLLGKEIIKDNNSKELEKTLSYLTGIHYQQYSPISFEITTIRFSNLVLAVGDISLELERFINDIKKDTVNFRVSDKINALRTANHQPKLKAVTDVLEESCFESLQIIDEQQSPEEHANDIIALARAVLVSSKADAEAYFEKAIESVSRFGDELVERWFAISSIAKHSSTQNINKPELAYRFMRCAELIGNTVAREKHWDRYDAVETCFKICPNSAFTITSRWKDREVGWSERNFAALITSAITMNTISPSTAWALAAFPFEGSLVQFAELCIEKEVDITKQQYIFDNLIKEYRQKGILGDTWLRINNLAKKYSLYSSVLDDLDRLVGNKKDRVISYPSCNYEEKENSKDIQKIYGDINFLSDVGLYEAIKIFNTLKPLRDSEKLWKYAASKVSSTNASEYLLLIANSEYLNFHHVRDAIKYFPEKFKNKPSVQKNWPIIIRTIASRFPERFINPYWHELIEGIISLDEITMNAIQEGVIQSLSGSNRLDSASIFYGFVGSCINKVLPNEAESILDFALARFELHIDNNYADGLWGTRLTPPTQVLKSLTGYIWASLGSPKSSERWEAMHVVRRLYELECQSEIDALLDWMLQANVDAFVGKNYPFYFLHAKQYLLIALLRCAVDDPSLLVKHYRIFLDIALKDKPHILIQKYAADITLAIHNIRPELFEEGILDALKQVGKTPFPTKNTDNYNEKHDTPWHKQGNIDVSLDLSFSYDFDQYWFYPLARIFKVPTEQVQQMAAEVIVNEWKLSFPERYMNDPREKLWQSNTNSHDTWHGHASYPKTDAYDFYLSYHAMMTVASKLLNAMPIIHWTNWHDNEWLEWLSRHQLTRKDNKWLADRRDFIPIERRQWVNDTPDQNWRWQVGLEDFLEVLLFDNVGTTWLNIAGSWTEHINGHTEDIYITSKLVPSWASSSLLRTIDSCQEHSSDMVGLGHFDKDRYINENIKHPFKLTSWYYQGDMDKGVDEFDPYAATIDYPPYCINQDIISEFRLLSDSEGRLWFLTDTNEVLLSSQLWSEGKPSREDDYCCKGNRLQSSLRFLTSMCEKLESDLIIQVNISRKYTGIYRNKENDEYSPPYRKIYILSKDGELRDTKSSFRLREKISKKT